MNPAVESCICTAYQKSSRKTKVRFFRIQEYYYILQLSYKGKGVSVEENLMYIILNYIQQNLNFLSYHLLTVLLSFSVTERHCFAVRNSVSFLTKIKTKSRSLVKNSNSRMLKIIHQSFFHKIARKYHHILTFFPDPKRVVSRD